MKKYGMLICVGLTSFNASAMLHVKQGIHRVLATQSAPLLARSMSSEADEQLKLHVKAGLLTDPMQKYRADSAAYTIALIQKRDGYELGMITNPRVKKNALWVAALSAIDVGAMNGAHAYGFLKENCYSYAWWEMADIVGRFSLAGSLLVVGGTAYSAAVSPRLIAYLNARIEEQEKELKRPRAESAESRVQSND